MVGNTFIIILCCVILGQVFSQGTERRREYRELQERLTRLEARLDSKS